MVLAEWEVRVEVVVSVGVEVELSDWNEEQLNPGCRVESETVVASHGTLILGDKLGLQPKSSREVGASEPRV